MVNYYELLGISQDAEKLAIEQAIKKTRRVWNNRANNPDASIRAEAERHVKEVAEAEKILLDPSKREAYDRDLATSPKEEGPAPQQQGDLDSMEDEYWEAYGRDMNSVAADIARKITEIAPNDARGWYLYGEALRRGGNSALGLQYLQKASILNPNNPNIYRQLAFAYLDNNKNGDALTALYNATKCDPDDAEYYALRAWLFRDAGMIDDSLQEGKTAYGMAPKDNRVRFEYFFALYEDALRSASYNRNSGKHLITSKVQLDYINGLLNEMSLTIPEDEDGPKCKARMEEIVKLVVDAESTKGGFFNKQPGYAYNYSISSDEVRRSGRH